MHEQREQIHHIRPAIPYVLMAPSWAVESKRASASEVELASGRISRLAGKLGSLIFGDMWLSKADTGAGWMVVVREKRQWRRWRL